MDIVSSIDQARGRYCNTSRIRHSGSDHVRLYWAACSFTMTFSLTTCPALPASIRWPAQRAANCDPPPLIIIHQLLQSPCCLRSPSSARRPAQDWRAGPAARPAPLPAPVVAVARRRGHRYLLRKQPSGAGVGRKGERGWAVICAWALPAGGRKGGGRGIGHLKQAAYRCMAMRSLANTQWAQL